jgi:hypothetical protein
MSIIAIFQCLFLIILLEYPFNNEKYIYEEREELKYVEIIQSVLTVILLWRIYNYYSYLVEYDRVRYGLPLGKC